MTSIKILDLLVGHRAVVTPELISQAPTLALRRVCNDTFSSLCIFPIILYFKRACKNTERLFKLFYMSVCLGAYTLVRFDNVEF
jgi:hypothetical protein